MLIHRPDERHLRAVYEWLKEEEEQEGHSFICNWGVVRDAFSDGRMMVETELDGVVSFFTWSQGARVIEGLVAATAPAWRGRGIGSRMMNAVHKHLQSAGAWAVHVECSPPPSEQFWRMQGYLDYPSGHLNTDASHTHLYKPLRVPHPPAVGAKRVDLWFKDTFGRTFDIPPDVSYSTQHDLAVPVERDWRARVVHANGEQIEDKVKRLVRQESIERGFLVARSDEWVI